MQASNIGNFVTGSGTSTCLLKTTVLTKSQGYIPPGVVFVLHWQFRSTQVKGTCNTNGSTYILYGLLITKKKKRRVLFSRD